MHIDTIIIKAGGGADLPVNSRTTISLASISVSASWHTLTTVITLLHFYTWNSQDSSDTLEHTVHSIKKLTLHGRMYARIYPVLRPYVALDTAIRTASKTCTKIVFYLRSIRLALKM